MEVASEHIFSANSHSVNPMSVHKYFEATDGDFTTCEVKVTKQHTFRSAEQSCRFYHLLAQVNPDTFNYASSAGKAHQNQLAD